MTHLFALILAALTAGLALFGGQELREFRERERERPYAALARQLNEHRAREACDDQLAKKRYYAAAVLDRFRREIQALWQARDGKSEPQFTLLDLGVIKLRRNPKAPPGKGFDSSAWSWEDVYGLIQRIQSDPGNKETGDRWRDVDSMVRFLLEKDYLRIVKGKKFPVPELTEHLFRPNPDVARTGPREFTVRLDPGAFRGHERALAAIFEDEWRSFGYRVKVLWTESGSYRLLAHFDSNRSYVNHKRRTMEIAHLAWTKTVAHELGHILGFDDHYYNVWNARNCYYQQESRLGDLMSNSEHGVITARHWEILDRAYPWKGERRQEPFAYVYGK